MKPTKNDKKANWFYRDAFSFFFIYLMKKIKQACTHEYELISTLSNALALKYKRNIQIILEDSFYLSGPCALHYVPKIDYIDWYLCKTLTNDLEKETPQQKFELLWESRELIIILWKYIKLYNACTWYNEYSWEKLEFDRRVLKMLISIIGITSHMITIILSHHLANQYLGIQILNVQGLDKKSFENILQLYIIIAAIWNPCNWFEKMYSLQKIMEKSWHEYIHPVPCKPKYYKAKINGYFVKFHTNKIQEICIDKMEKIS